MRDFLYDFRRTFTGKFTIIMIILIILASVGLTYAGVAISASSNAGGSPSTSAYLLPEIYQSQNGFNFTDYVVNGYGQPVSGLAINSNATMYNGSNTIGGKVYLNGTTNSQGFVYFHMDGNTTLNELVYNYSNSFSNGIGNSAGEAFLLFSPKGTTTFYPNAYGASSLNNLKNTTNVLYFLKVANPSSQSLSSEMVYFAASNKTVVPAISVYYNITGSTSPSLPSSTHGMTFYKNLTGSNHYLFTIPLNKTAARQNVQVVFANSTGAILGGNNYVLYSYVSPAAILQTLLEFPYEFLIPIIGIFSAYFYYGKDRTSGVLESVITRPVTKGRLFASRFVGTAATFFVAIIIAILMADLLLLHYTGSLMGWDSFFGLVLGYTIEAIAFSGIMYIISQFVKSQGALLGIGIGIFFLLVFVWSIVVDVLLLYLHVNSATVAGYSMSIKLLAISPTFFPTLVNSYVTGVYPPTFGLTTGLSLASASSMGITLAAVVAVGAIWIMVPSLISFFLARSRD